MDDEGNDCPDGRVPEAGRRRNDALQGKKKEPRSSEMCHQLEEQHDNMLAVLTMRKTRVRAAKTQWDKVCH
jgi:hypothetical protein